MTLPFQLPDWLPWWAGIAVLVPALIYLLAFLVMPFNVLGVRGRLDVIEARLDELQGEIRALVVRLPEPGRGRAVVPAEDGPPVGPPAEDPVPARAPPQGRVEPRLGWPR